MEHKTQTFYHLTCLVVKTWKSLSQDLSDLDTFKTVKGLLQMWVVQCDFVVKFVWFLDFYQIEEKFLVYRMGKQK